MGVPYISLYVGGRSVFAVVISLLVALALTGLCVIGFVMMAAHPTCVVYTDSFINGTITLYRAERSIKWDFQIEHWETAVVTDLIIKGPMITIALCGFDAERGCVVSNSGRIKGKIWQTKDGGPLFHVIKLLEREWGKYVVQLKTTSVTDNKMIHVK